jgi:hypothetical protein
MKNLILIMLFLPGITFGQQILWSTAPVEIFQGEEIKQIPIENVTEEVMKFCDYYNRYFDGTGFTKEGLSKTWKALTELLHFLGRGGRA